MEGIALKEELRSAGVALKRELGKAGIAIALAILLCLLIGISVAIYPGWVQAWEFMDKNFLLSKEAPAWIQAIGSVGAILIAVWISRSGERAAAQHAVISARAFASIVNRCFNSMKQGAELDQRSAVRIIQGSLEEALVSGRVIRVELLPPSCISAVLSIRAMAGAILHAAGAYSAGLEQHSRHEFLQTLNAYWIPLSEHVLELSRAHSGLPEVA